MKAFISFPLIVLLWVLTVPAAAHHSHAPFYHMDREVEVTGVSVEFKFTSPHSQLLLEVEENGEKVIYRITAQNNAGLKALGLDPGMVEPGTVLTIIGNPSRNPNVLSIAPTKVMAEDGSEIPWGL